MKLKWERKDDFWYMPLQHRKAVRPIPVLVKWLYNMDQKFLKENYDKGCKFSKTEGAALLDYSGKSIFPKLLD